MRLFPVSIAAVKLIFTLARRRAFHPNRAATIFVAGQRQTVNVFLMEKTGEHTSVKHLGRAIILTTELIPNGGERLIIGGVNERTAVTVFADSSRSAISDWGLMFITI